ncbi:hypothetical protein Sjap_012614 [Stephania japonica]|uniref:Inhibitor of Bruton tyrosine kinase n=1 Tax=Stephania japonica TaxID=461633 RepID=A0AAP0IW87_9MAGN
MSDMGVCEWLLQLVCDCSSDGEDDGMNISDLYSITREGTLAEVDSALTFLKKIGGTIDSRNVFGLTPLHIATWRNHIPIVRRLLAAGADPNARLLALSNDFLASTTTRCTVNSAELIASRLSKTLISISIRMTIEFSDTKQAADWPEGFQFQVSEDAIYFSEDGESGWSSLHRALHFGHLAVASILLQSGASLTLEDSKSRTPIDLLSGPVLQAVGDEPTSVSKEVFSWGSGTNYQLGTGNAHIQKLPCKLDTLQGCSIKLVSAAKFHSVAVGSHGEVYTWGFGRGGRLGHPDFDIHSGQAAVITPRLVTSGLGSRRVKAIAAAKHHTIVATEGGEVFTWGSNREGQLGYTSVDTQPTPRRVSSLRVKVVSVAAANKHTAVISESGEVFTWGCNKEGQLGYGTSNSASNYTPRMVEYLKGRVLTGVSAAKYHTVVLGADGEVFTWGHRLVTPRRVVIARNIKKSSGTQLKFHRMQRLHVVAIAAGMVHSLALTDDGALFYWVSSDPDLRCQQLYSLCWKSLASISAGKYWTSAVTTTGDVYMWDAKNNKNDPPAVTRLHGVKRATSVSVGETHLLIVCALYHHVCSHDLVKNGKKPRCEIQDEVDELNEDLMFTDAKREEILASVHIDSSGKMSVPSLKSLCEKTAIESLVEPRNSVQMLEIADSLGADELRKHCEDIAIRNLDYIFSVSQAITNASPDVLANLEKLLDKRSSEPWSYRQLPTPTATFPVIINSEEENDTEYLRFRDNHTEPVSRTYRDQKSDCFLALNGVADQAIFKQVRAVRKKLQQIEMLETKQSSGHPLDDQQISKIQTRTALENSLAELGVPVDTQDNPSPVSLDNKWHKKAASKKQRRKNKYKIEEAEATIENCGEVELKTVKGFLEIETPLIPEQKEREEDLEEINGNHVSEKSPPCSPKKCVSDGVKSKSSKTAASKKKKKKKGGLSMFLSGALDDAPKDVTPPTPKSDGPAWGGARISKGSTSLLAIQSEQSKMKQAHANCKAKDRMEDPIDATANGQLRLRSFMPVGVASSPIAVVPSCASPLSDSEKSTPPWSISGSSPILSRPSLRDIQVQQEKHHQSLSHSPKTRTTGFSVPSGQGSPSDFNGPNRWFKPDSESPSSIRSIQIEEKAIKDLKRFYNNVKLVKNQTKVL